MAQPSFPGSARSSVIRRLLLAGGLDHLAAVLQGDNLIPFGFEHEPE